jgi:capsule polysaccharide export protein KpsE/RkpR
MGGIGCLIGWTINGWRLSGEIQSIKADHAQQLADYYAGAREAEIDLIKAVKKIREDKDGQIKDLNARLGSALSELQQRQTRVSGSDTTRSCSAATGAELSKEDAEFLAREAARADTVVGDLNYCIAQYNLVRDKLIEGNNKPSK